MSEKMVFADKPVKELIAELNVHLKQIGYRPSSLKTYGGILNRLQDYCSTKSFDVFTMELGRNFIQDCYGAVLGERNRFKNISRAIHMLADFQRFGMVFKQHNCYENKYVAPVP